MATKSLKLNVISDIHYYSESTGCSGSAYERARSRSQKLLCGCADALSECFDRLAEDSTEIVLVAGDVTNNGEKAAHEGVIKLLRSLKERGKRVYVITATHDYKGDATAPGYDGDNDIRVPAYKREELFELYREFGPDEAIAVHEKSMSYVVQLDDGYRLFALNDDSNLDNSSGFSDECFEWITEQVDKAKADGQFIVAMTHHPNIAPSPFYSIIGKGDMMGGWQYRREQLADMGINFLLTGHTHIQDISYVFSSAGNVFYDVSVASPVGFPGTYRTLTCDAEKRTVDVKTVDFAKEAKLCVGGLPLYKALERQLCGVIEDVLDAAATDPKKFAYMAVAFSIKPEKGVRIGRLVRPAAKWLKGLTVGKLAKKVRKKTGLAPADYADIADDRVVDFIISLVLHLFSGDSTYTPDTAYYKITVAVLDKIDTILRRVHFNIGKVLKGAESVRGLVEPLLYNDGICDREALLDLDAKQGKQLNEKVS